MQNKHNPQAFTPNEYGGPEGFRLLTHEEAAVLTDPESAKTHLATILKERLRPELYNEATAAWQRVISPRFNESFTYRTEAPELEPEDLPDMPVSILDNADFREAVAENINQAVFLCHGLAVAAGWHSDLKTGQRVPVNVPEKLLLIVTEIAEATEGFRKNLADDKLPQRSMLEVELVDAVIRIFDLGGALGLDLGGAMVDKLVFNQHRADHKPENRRATNGKAF